MKHKMEEKIEVPEGINCSYVSGILACKKDSKEYTRRISIPGASVKVENNLIILSCIKGNKSHYNKIKSNIAHIKNIFSGLQEKFVYKLESANVHFPMTLKVDSGFLIINNFLGEKFPRRAKILHSVDVEVKGNLITISSHDKEAAGQTAANFEKAGKVKSRDRRVFQDGIYIVERPGGTG